MAGKKGGLFGLFGNKNNRDEDEWEDDIVATDEDDEIDIPVKEEKTGEKEGIVGKEAKPEDDPKIKEESEGPVNMEMKDLPELPDIPFPDTEDTIREVRETDFYDDEDEPYQTAPIPDGNNETGEIVQQPEAYQDDAASEQLKEEIIRFYNSADPKAMTKLKIEDVVLGVLQYGRFVPNSEIPKEDVAVQKQVVTIINQLIYEKKSDANKEEGQETTIVTKDTSLEGNIASESPLLIEGSIRGNIVTQESAIVTGFIMGNLKSRTVTIKGGKVKGDLLCDKSVDMDPASAVVGNITADDVTIGGSIEGNIDASGTVTLMSTAIVVGDVKAQNMIMNNGAVFYGKCIQDYAPVDILSCLSKIDESFKGEVLAIEEKLMKIDDKTGMLAAKKEDREKEIAEKAEKAHKGNEMQPVNSEIRAVKKDSVKEVKQEAPKPRFVNGDNVTKENESRIQFEKEPVTEPSGLSWDNEDPDEGSVPSEVFMEIGKNL